MFVTLFLFLNLVFFSFQDPPPASPVTPAQESEACDYIICPSGFVCVNPKSPDNTGPLCVPAGPWSCLDNPCVDGYHCCSQEIPACANPPCYPMPLCVQDGYKGDLVIPSQDQPATTESNPSPPEGSQAPPLPPPPPPTPPSGGGSPGFTDATNPPPAQPNGNNGTFNSCTEDNPCFIGFKCIILPNGNAGCQKVITCSDLFCPLGQRCIPVPLTKDAYCAPQPNCTQTGCSSGQICVNDNNNTPFCRRPQTCNDISCSVTNNCRSGDNQTDAVCVAKCPSSETWNNCSSCESSCSNQNNICDTSCQPNTATCVCNSGLVRGPNGTCIGASQCPEASAPTASPPVTPASGVDLYNRCKALNCSSGQQCIVNGSDIYCGSNGEVQCKCTQEQICILQVAANCGSSSCVLLPTCVNYPVINPPAQTTTEPPIVEAEQPAEETKPSAEEPEDPCDSMECYGLQCVVMADGSAQCISNEPPKVAPPPPPSPPGGPY